MTTISSVRAVERLRVRPASLAEARTFVARHHRHNQPPVGHKFSLAVQAGDRTCGVAVIGLPIARMLNDGMTLEVTRVCTDGTANACSHLLGAAWRAARELGYRRLVTYTQAAETGASLRSAGWRHVANLRPRNGWDRPSRFRRDTHPTRVPRRRWEITTSDYTPAFRNATTGPRDETPRCQICGDPAPRGKTGRPRRYCSPACRQFAYRDRIAQRHEGQPR